GSQSQPGIAQATQLDRLQKSDRWHERHLPPTRSTRTWPSAWARLSMCSWARAAGRCNRPAAGLGRVLRRHRLADSHALLARWSPAGPLPPIHLLRHGAGRFHISRPPNVVAREIFRRRGEVAVAYPRKQPVIRNSEMSSNLGGL